MAFGYSQRGYGAIIKENTAGTAIKPTNYFKFDTESIVTGYESEVLSPVANTRSLNYQMVAGKNAAPTGTISMPVQMPSIGHFLSGAFGSPTTTGPTDSLYTHAFVSSAAGSIPTYTVDIGYTDQLWVNRYVGARFGGLKFTPNQHNAWYFDATLMARYSFTSAKLAAGTTAGGTALTLDSNYGLTTSDSLILGAGTAGEETVTISAVNVNGIGVTCSITANNHSASDLVLLKTSTPSYSTATDAFQWMGGTTTQIGTTLGGVATAAIFKDFSLDVSQGLEPIYAPNGTTDFSRFPIEIVVMGYGSTASMRTHFTSRQYDQYIKDRQDIAVNISSTGSLVGVTSVDTFQLQIPKLRIDPSGVNLGGNKTLEQTLAGKCANSVSDGFDIKAIIKNATASY